VRSARERSQVPIVLFGYYNPILAYGEEAFCRAAADAGVDGLLVVDLPVEEGASLRGHAERAGLAYVPLVAPTSSDARVDRAAAVATGFVYYVSTTGVTGAAAADLDRAGQRAGSIGERTGRPVAVGFGIKTPEDVALVAPHADGAVVGSAVVRAIEEAPDADAAERAVSTLVSRLAAATAR
jgi:tryptophan synthase alpha chain